MTKANILYTVFLFYVLPLSAMEVYSYEILREDSSEELLFQLLDLHSEDDESQISLGANEEIVSFEAQEIETKINDKAFYSALYETLFPCGDIPDVDEIAFNDLEKIVQKNLLILDEKERLSLISKLIKNLAKNEVKKSTDLLTDFQYLLLGPFVKYRPSGKNLPYYKLGRPLVIAHGACSQGKDAQKATLNDLSPKGEDAFFIAPKSEKTFFAVADGVGASENPRYFVSSLMKRSFEVADKEIVFSPLGIFNDAFLQVALDKDKDKDKDKELSRAQDEKASISISGATTALYVSIDHETGRCEIVNIGDSSLLILRGTEIILHTREGQHEWNAPHAVGFKNDGILGFEKNEINKKYEIIPNILEEYRLTLLPGDILIAGTDGLFDNLFVSEIIECIDEIPKLSEQMIMADEMLATHISALLVAQARMKMKKIGTVSAYGKVMSPFSIATLSRLFEEKNFERLMKIFSPPSKNEEDFMQQMYELALEGAKRDDVTVVTVLVH